MEVPRPDLERQPKKTATSFPEPGHGAAEPQEVPHHNRSAFQSSDVSANRCKYSYEMAWVPQRTNRHRSQCQGTELLSRVNLKKSQGKYGTEPRETLALWREGGAAVKPLPEDDR